MNLAFLFYLRLLSRCVLFESTLTNGGKKHLVVSTVTNTSQLYVCQFCNHFMGSRYLLVVKMACRAVHGGNNGEKTGSAQLRVLGLPGARQRGPWATSLCPGLP